MSSTEPGTAAEPGTPAEPGTALERTDHYATDDRQGTTSSRVEGATTHGEMNPFGA